MELQYNKKRFISVIELSSTGIKTLSAAPLHVRKRHELQKFSDNRVINLNSAELINDHNQIDLEAFRKNILPKVLKYFEGIKKYRDPIALKIIATGHYRLVDNSDEVIDVLKKSIENIDPKGNFRIELLSAREEARLSYWSWVRTYKFKSNSEQNLSADNLSTMTGMHIDIGGATTEISIVQNAADFSQTISLPTEISKYALILSTDEKYSAYNTLYTMRELIYEVASNALEKFAHWFKRYNNIEYAVITGGSIMYDPYERRENFYTLYKRGNLDYLINSLEYRVNTKRRTGGEKEIIVFQRILAYSILKTLLKYAKVDSYHSNRANLRIGCFYDMMDRLRKNESPY